MILACYANRSGAVRIVDSATTSCPRGETLVSWNQKGLKGDKGDTGDRGDAGVAGADGVGFAWRGSWSEGVEYARNDVVHVDGSAYILRSEKGGGGTQPSEPDSGWELFAAKGSPGETGPEGPRGPEGPQGPPGTVTASKLTLTKVSQDSPNGANVPYYVTGVVGTEPYSCGTFGLDTCYRDVYGQVVGGYNPGPVSATVTCPAGSVLFSGVGNGETVVDPVTGLPNGYKITGTAWANQFITAHAFCTEAEIAAA